MEEKTNNLPPELWLLVARHLDLASFFRVAFTCRSKYSILLKGIGKQPTLTLSALMQSGSLIRDRMYHGHNVSLAFVDMSSTVSLWRTDRKMLIASTANLDIEAYSQMQSLASLGLHRELVLSLLHFFGEADSVEMFLDNLASIELDKKRRTFFFNSCLFAVAIHAMSCNVSSVLLLSSLYTDISSFLPPWPTSQSQSSPKHHINVKSYTMAPLSMSSDSRSSNLKKRLHHLLGSLVAHSLYEPHSTPLLPFLCELEGTRPVLEILTSHAFFKPEWKENLLLRLATEAGRSNVVELLLAKFEQKKSRLQMEAFEDVFFYLCRFGLHNEEKFENLFHSLLREMMQQEGKVEKGFVYACGMGSVDALSLLLPHISPEVLNEGFKVYNRHGFVGFEAILMNASSSSRAIMIGERRADIIPRNNLDQKDNNAWDCCIQ